MHIRWSISILLLISVHAPACAAPTKEAEAYFGNAVALIQDKHINSGSAEWKKIKAKAVAQIGGAKTTADTYPAIRFVLGALGEKHSFLMEPRPPATPPAVSAIGAPQQGALLPKWRLVAGKFGLVQLPELDTLGDGREETGRRYAQELRAGLTSMDKHKLCGWIIDLRENGGGNMWPMLQGLDPLLGSAPFGFFVGRRGVLVPWARTPSGIFPAMQPAAESTPSFSLVHQNAPVAVLIGPRTSSSGEMTALAFIGRARVRTFGAPSAGFTTANVPYPLSDGAFLVITETAVRDRSGKDYKGPIVPDQKVSLVNAERAASAWLAGNCWTSAKGRMRSFSDAAQH